MDIFKVEFTWRATAEAPKKKTVEITAESPAHALGTVIIANGALLVSGDLCDWKIWRKVETYEEVGRAFGGIG